MLTLAVKIWIKRTPLALRELVELQQSIDHLASYYSNYQHQRCRKHLTSRCSFPFHQNWTIDKMVETSEDFFKNIGLFEMTMTFKQKSIFNQTKWGKEMICHASAEDFCLGPGSEDFRIKMCTSVNMVDLITVHHEMGHIEYFMAYRDLPFVFRESANPGKSKWPTKL